MDVAKAANGAYNVSIEWADGAARRHIWKMTAKPLGAGGVLYYENGEHIVRSFAADGTFTDEVKYTDGAGQICLNSANELMWEDEKDNVGENVLFVSVK